MNMDVSIIIVNYKTVSLILKCLNSIQRLTRKISYEIIVVDNNSNDDFATYIQQQYPKVKCVSLPENMGFGRANNEGVKLANRGIGMAGAMAHSVGAIAYQFKNPNTNLNTSSNSFLGKVFSKENTSTTNNQITTEMNKTKMETKPMETTDYEGKKQYKRNFCAGL